MVEIKAPAYPESIEEGTLLTWYVADGDHVERDTKIADVETDKVVLEVFATAGGILSIAKEEGDILLRDDLVATIQSNGNVPPPKVDAPAAPEPVAAPAAPSTPELAPALEPMSIDTDRLKGLSPSVRKLIVENDLNPEDIPGTGKDGRITQSDVKDYITHSPTSRTNIGAETEAPSVKETPKPTVAIPVSDGAQRRVPMSRIRARIAERLLEVQQTSAILTTFNEVNMKPVMDLRARYKERFAKEYGTKLGLMSFFVKATVEALKKIPSINAFVDGKDVVYNEEFHIGIAVDSPRGLLVPVLRNVEHMSFADIEKTIRGYAADAQDAKIKYEDLIGGTFTITNGGVFGSMMSTPILNAPQSGILGMHSIINRPIAEDGEVVIRPMMYTALSYDHRIVDGRAAVQFLVAIKESLEDPAQLLLQI